MEEKEVVSKNCKQKEKRVTKLVRLELGCWGWLKKQARLADVTMSKFLSEIVDSYCHAGNKRLK